MAIVTTARVESACFPRETCSKDLWKVKNYGSGRCRHRAFSTQRAPNPPEFAQPRLSRSNGGRPQREGIRLGMLFLHCSSYPGVRLQIWVSLICVISPHSNGAARIRVGLKFTEVQKGLLGICRDESRKLSFKNMVPDPRNCQVRKVAEQKLPEIFECSARVFSQVFPRNFPKFSRIFHALFPGQRRPLKFTKSHTISQFQIPKQIRRKNSQFFW